jgi:uncharacterized protein (TIGR04255 family)
MAELPLPSQMQSPSVIARPSGLPDFEHPPVVEVALSVQFEPLLLETRHVAGLWEKCRSEFPEWQDQAPIAPAFELFGQGAINMRAMRIDLANMPLRRAIFRNAAGTELKQYQADRFVRNWTKAPSAPSYPRYESVRESFADDLRLLMTFVAEQSVGSFVANQCEVTYVNLISLTGASPRTIADVVSPWTGAYSDGFLQDGDSAEMAAHFVVTDPSSADPVGRLHIAGVPVTEHESGGKALQLTLTARGQPLGSGVDGVLAFLDLGRKYIVKGFTSFTTPTMHKTWGRRDGSNS